MQLLPIDLGEGAALRPLALEDADEVFALVEANRDHLRPWMSWEPTTRTVDDVGGFIGKHVDDREANGLTVDGRLAGVVGLKVDEMVNSGEIGYWLARDAEGRGLITRACRRVFDEAFDSIGLHRMELHAAVTNVRSRAVAERLGMREEAVLREAERVDAGYLDRVVYGVLEDEWRAGR